MRKYIALLLLNITLSTKAQVTYNHDASKMNQVTVMETGAGSLTPELYYEIFHSDYNRNASETNKLTFRSGAAISGYNQLPYADSIESHLKKRAEIEALNVADRTGGALDLAWASEGRKIEAALSRYRNNISRITVAGGTVEDKVRWQEYSKAYDNAIKAIREAYMPNSQRKKEYLSIYEDIVRQNENLVKHIASLQTLKNTREILASRNQYTTHKDKFARQALERWQTNSMQSERGVVIDTDIESNE